MTTELPIPLGPCSNTEYDPVPPSPVIRETARRAREQCEVNARRIGMSRRTFLRSAMGAATTLSVLAACSKESDGGREQGGTFDVPPESTTEPEAAQEAVGGQEFVFDVQTHLLEYDESAPSTGFFGQGFPQADCGEADPRDCFRVDHFMDEVFLNSDTSMIVLSAIPVVGEDQPLSIGVMEEVKGLTDRLCGDGRVLLQGHPLPSTGAAAAALDAMDATAAAHPIAAWKVYTHAGGPPWYLDDHDPGVARVGGAFVERALALDIPIIAVHKGFSGGSRYASPVDIGPAAAAHRDARFVVYHSGYEAGGAEGPYEASTAERGVNRLITSLRRSGIGPNQNVYAELGSTWFNLMRSPEQAAHVLGKLLVHVGEDNLLWGTDSIWYGSPQSQIQAFRSFQISPALQERYGYPALTAELKAKVLGGNAARLYGVDPVVAACRFDRRELEELRIASPAENRTFGPQTAAASRAAFARAHGAPA